MDFPPGRAEQLLSGGPQVLSSLLDQLRAGRFTGVLSTSLLGPDGPATGSILFHR